MNLLLYPFIPYSHRDQELTPLCLRILVRMTDRLDKDGRSIDNSVTSTQTSLKDIFPATSNHISSPSSNEDDDDNGSASEDSQMSPVSEKNDLITAFSINEALKIVLSSSDLDIDNGNLIGQGFIPDLLSIKNEVIATSSINQDNSSTHPVTVPSIALDTPSRYNHTLQTYPIHTHTQDLDHVAPLSASTSNDIPQATSLPLTLLAVQQAARVAIRNLSGLQTAMSELFRIKRKQKAASFCLRLEALQVGLSDTMFIY